MAKTLLPLALICLCFYARAQSNWTQVPENTLPQGLDRPIIPQVYKVFRLSVEPFRNTLLSVPLQNDINADNTVLIGLPTPEGNVQHFRIEETPVMAPALQNRYPEIRCYTGRGIENQQAVLKCDWTPQGFHAVVFTPGQSPVYIDPYARGHADLYTVYYKKDFQASKADVLATCDTDRDAWQPIALTDYPESQGDCRMRKYRMALACTGEYAAFHGGTKALALAAMNTTMNRINGIYEREFAVTMEIVANNDTLVFLDGATDPYTNNNSSEMLGQNITTCNARIGINNYDIGHVFSTGGGGVAGLGVVCTSQKARGVTGGSSPVGDPFDVDYVAHEIGHQFGANHTQNNDCNRVQGVSMEPGSGSTIMAYAGICSPNVQNNSEDYFHAINLQEISAFINTGVGNSCPVKTVTGNQAPIVSGGPDYTIPKSSYFALTATGSDADGDTLTYCWEQMDPEFANMPPEATSTVGPMFRSFQPNASPTRYFPRLQDIITNANPNWEKLPSVARTLKFRVTLRDNHAGAGCTDIDDVTVTIAGNAGPFVVTAPNTNVVWNIGELQTVTWNVAGSDVAPVSCSLVRIWLSTDGGLSYPNLLAASVPNNGSAAVLVPNTPSNNCRVKVEAVDNIFFDISNQDFRIVQPSVGSFLLAFTADTATVCAGDTVGATAIVTTLSGFNSPVQFSLSGLPLGATAQINPNPLTGAGNAELLLSGFTPAMAGQYTVTLSGTALAINRTDTIILIVNPGSPSGAAVLVSPAAGAHNFLPGAPLRWNAVPFAQFYQVQIATDPAFNNLVVDAAIVDTNYIAALLPATVYYWKIRPGNVCGDGETSAVWAFQTSDQACNQIFNSADVPKTILANSANTVTSVIDIPNNDLILDVSVQMTAAHSFTGDLAAKLIAPNGQEFSLFDRPGYPEDIYGCANDNVDLSFDDQAVLSSIDLENTCNANGIALLGEFQPIDALGALHTQSVQGIWTLSVRDQAAQDGGSLTAWSLSFCFPDNLPTGAIVANDTLFLATGASAALDNLEMALSGGSAAGVFILTTVPQHGALTLNGQALGLGDIFTQADINNGLVSYTHNGDNASADQFYFDALDTNNDAWVYNTAFNIVIIQNNLIANAQQTAAISCNGGNNGQITATASGLDGQYTYSLNGSPFQASGVFSNLSAGTYTVTVSGQFGYTAVSNAVVLSNPANVVVVGNVLNNDLTASASGGAGMFTYSLDGLVFQANNTFLNLPNGVYTLIAQDQNGCTGTTTVIVSLGALTAAGNVVMPPSCVGASDGVINATVAGGSSPYTYSLNGVDFQNDNTFSGLAAGVYTITVRDMDGIETITAAITLSDPPAIVINVGTVFNTLTVMATGGAGSFQYSLNGVDFQSGNIFTDLPNGIYTVTARDGNGCTGTSSVTVDVPPLEALAFETDAIRCFGDQTGEIAVLATGGIPPYEYRFGNGAFQSANIFGNLAAGDYSFTVRDATGTEYTVGFTLGQPDPVNVDVIIVDNDVSLDISGGIPPYTYTLNGIPDAPLMDLDPGQYQVLVSDVNGCLSSAFFEILGNTISAFFSGTEHVRCHGEASGSSYLCIDGGYQPVYVTMSPVAGLVDTLSGICQQNYQYTNLPAGIYTFTVTDNAGFTQVQTLMIDEPAPLQIGYTVNVDTIFAQVSGGVAPYGYSLNGIAYDSLAVFADLPNGDYTLYIRDDNGCVDSLSGITVQYIGTNNVLNQWGVVLSPNPGSGQFGLFVANAPASLSLQVYDMAGKRLYAENHAPAGSFRTLLDLYEYPQGNYCLYLSDGSRWATLKMQIVR